MDTVYVQENIEQVVSKFAEYNTFGFDLETSGLNPVDSRILLAQISFPDHNFVINTALVDLEPIMSFFSSRKWTKIIQNAKFDTKFLLKYYKTRTKGIFDTMLAERLITSQQSGSSSLKTIAEKYLGITLDKDTRESFINMDSMQAFSSEQLAYAAKDSEILFGIMDAQKSKLDELGMTDVSELEFELSTVVADMELTGVPVDKNKWTTILSDYAIEHEASRLRMNGLLFDDVPTTEQIGMFVRDAINLNSPQQVKAAFERIGIKLPNGTAERELAVIDKPAAKELLHYRELQKVMTSYGETFLGKIHPFTGRIHADYQQIGTETGRFACKDPNLQQMPDQFRQCVSLKDHVIVAADYSNIELRILAELSKDPALLQAFSTGQDPHKSTASIMFNIDIDSITPEQRFIAKTINFGISYGMGPYKLMDMLNAKKEHKKDYLGFRQVQAIHNRYKETYKKAAQWLEDAGNLSYRQGYSTTMMGRKRFFERPGAEGDRDKQIAAIKRQGANSPIQGTNADITKLAMLNLYDDLKTYGYRADIILQVHDEIGVLAHKSQAESVKMLVKESMLRSGQELLKTVPVKVDVYASSIWKKG